MKRRLGDLFTLQMGKTPSRNESRYWQGGNNKWVSIADMSRSGMYVECTKEQITDEAVRESGIKPIPKDTVLLSFKLSLGKVSITQNDTTYTNEAIMAFVDEAPERKVLPHYLYFALQSVRWSQIGNRAVMGTTLNKRTLSELEINVIPLCDQLKIVDKLTMLDSIIDRAYRILYLLNLLVKSRFIEMFGNCKDEIQLRNCCSKITKGTTPTTMGFGFSNEGVNYIKVECLDDAGNYIDDKIAHVSIECHEKLKRSQLQEGDILFSIAGALGRTAIVPARLLPANTNQALAIIRLENEEVFDRAFLRYALTSKTVEKILARQKRGVAQSNLSLNDVGKIAIPHPPLSLQKEFAIFVQRSEKLRFDELGQG